MLYSFGIVLFIAVQNKNHYKIKATKNLAEVRKKAIRGKTF
jgi:hypothetical protein